MAPQPEQKENWPLNYFNYFTEVEEHFQRARGTSLFLLSSLDWALLEAWKEAGIPLEAVLRGIDLAFEKWREKKNRVRQINGLAFCAQPVMEEAQRMEQGLPAAPGPVKAEAPFTLEELAAHLSGAARQLEAAGLAEIGAAMNALAQDAGKHYTELEPLEQRLSALEDKMIAQLRGKQSEQDLFEARRELDAQLRPYRGKMTAPQLSMLEKQYLDRWLLERNALPRLSLFYLR